MSSIAQEHRTARPAKAHAMPKRYFSPRRVLLCALPLLVLVLWILALAGLATAGGTATADQPARMAVQVPSSAKSSSVVMLEMSIAVTRKAPAGQLGAVVRLRPSGGSAVEVGRVSIPGGSQSFQFNVSHVLGARRGRLRRDRSLGDRPRRRRAAVRRGAVDRPRSDRDALTLRRS